MARNTASLALTVLFFFGCASTATQDPTDQKKALETEAAAAPEVELQPEPAAVAPAVAAPAAVELGAPALPVASPSRPASTRAKRASSSTVAPVPPPAIVVPMAPVTPTPEPAASPSVEAPVVEAPPAPSADVTPASATTAPVEPATAAEVMSAVERLPGLSSWTVIPFAHFRRGARHVVVAWPALNSSGRLVDATVVGICLEETADGLEECGRRWVVRDQAAARSATAAALGGSDYEVVGRSAGRELDDLGPEMSRLGTAFAQAVSSGNRSAARQAATSFSRLLPLGTVAYGNDVARLLWAASSHGGRLEHVDTVRQGDEATLTFSVTRSGFRFQTIRATARPVSEGSDRWIVTSYES